MSKTVLYTFLLATVAAFSAACSNDEPQVAAPVQAGFSISAPLRAPSAESDAANDHELINTWWMAFVDENNKVQAIVRRAADKKDAVESESFHAEVPTGTYMVYAFANITETELEAQTGLAFRKGQNAPAGVDDAVWASLENLWDKDTDLPMSGKKSVTVTGHIDEPFNIEVVRMVAKMEFVFSNHANEPITVNSVTLRPLATGPLSLFATNLGTAPALPAGTGTEIVSYKFPGTEAARTLALNTEKGLKDYFYVHESLGEAHPTGHFVVNVDISRSGKPEEQLYSLAGELTYINRNDYIRIPIRFTDYLTAFDVLFYPPIGGYPAVIKEEKDDEYYIKFGTPGKFVITPLVREAMEGSSYLQPGTLGIAIASVGGDNIFVPNGEPAYNNGEIIGELSTATGRAEVTVTFSVAQQNGVSHTYDRKIYIIRENA